MSQICTRRSCSLPHFPRTTQCQKKMATVLALSWKPAQGAQFAEPKPTSHTQALSMTPIAHDTHFQGRAQCQKKMATVLALSWKPARGPYSPTPSPLLTHKRPSQHELYIAPKGAHYIYICEGLELLLPPQPILMEHLVLPVGEPRAPGIAKS